MSTVKTNRIENNAGTAGFDVATIPDGGGFSMRNKIINGGFDIWQRGTSFSSSVYTADRWGLYKASGAMVLTKDDVTPNILGYNRLKLRVSTVHADAQIYQKIEDVRTLQGKTVTLSFNVYTSANFKVQLKHSFGVGSATSERIFYDSPTTEVITSTWSKVSITTQIPELLVTDDVVSGSFLQVTLFIGANLGSHYIKDVQLEEGSVATPFEQRPYGMELSLCQRYYFNTSGVSYVNDGYHIGYGYVTLQMLFPVTMRTTPSLTYTTNSQVNVRSSTVQAEGPYGFELLTRALAQGRCLENLTSLIADAEIY